MKKESDSRKTFYFLVALSAIISLIVLSPAARYQKITLVLAGLLTGGEFLGATSWGSALGAYLLNAVLSIEEQEEWLGDLKEIQSRMIHEKRSQWLIRLFTLNTYLRFGINKAQSLLVDVWIRITSG